MNKAFLVNDSGGSHEFATLLEAVAFAKSIANTRAVVVMERLHSTHRGRSVFLPAARVPSRWRA